MVGQICPFLKFPSMIRFRNMEQELGVDSGMCGLKKLINNSIVEIKEWRDYGYRTIIPNKSTMFWEMPREPRHYQFDLNQRGSCSRNYAMLTNAFLSLKC